MNTQTQRSSLSSSYPLTQQQIDSYQRDGHVLLPGVCPPAEVEFFRPVFKAMVDAKSADAPPLEQRDTYGKAFLQIMNLWTEDERARAFTLSRRFGEIAARLMQSSGARLYHDQTLYKEGGGGHTPWHQDQFYWPLDGVSTVTMWMPLVDCPVEMGALTFASGSQKDGFLGHIAISDESEDTFTKYVEEKGYPVVNQAMQAGDATFHSGWTLHCAPGNQTSVTREVMTIIYFAEGACISSPDNYNRQADMETWFPGLKPGDLAASPINPLVFAGI